MLKRIICACSLVAVLVAQQPAPSPRAVELLIGKARALETRGRNDLAAQIWRQLLMLQPEQQDALAGLARIAKLEGKDSDADSYLKRLRKSNPASAAIQQIEAMDETARRNPELEAAAKLAASGKAEEAIAAYRRAFGENPPSDWLVPFYETLSGTPGGWEQATAGLERAMRQHPSSQGIKLALGRLYTYRPTTRFKGVALLESVTGPSTGTARQAWRQALIWEAGSPRSADSVRAFLSRYPDPELQDLASKQQKVAPATTNAGLELKRAYQALEKNELSNALNLFEGALNKNPREVGALTGVGFVLMKQQDFAGALKKFELALDIAPANKAALKAATEARFWLAMQAGAAALKASRSEEAVDLFKKAVGFQPDKTEALEGYAGALMQRGEYAAALPVLERLVKSDATHLRNWKDLILAKQHTSGAQSALEAAANLPEATATKLNGDLEYLAAITGLQQRTGRTAEAKKTFGRAAVVAEKSTQELPVYLEMQIGDLYLNFGNPGQAVKRYRTALTREPSNLEAWEGFLIASNRMGAAGPALQTLETLPASVHEAAQNRPSFLRAVAALESSVGSLDSAESLLIRAREIETADGKDASFYTRLQTAQLALQQGRGANAARSFEDLAQSYPDNEEVWKGLVLSLQKSGALEQATDAIRRIPSAVGTVLGGDPDYVAAVSSLYSETRSAAEAIRFLRESIVRLTADGRSVPPGLTAQLAWLLLDTPGNERELFTLLRNAQTRTDLSAQQRRTLDEIWTAWLTRSADAASANGDPRHAISILESGIRMMPGEVRLQRALAANLLTAGDAKRAMALYQAGGLREALATDYVAAVGAALGAEEKQIAETWLKQGLTTHPNDIELLTLAGKQSAVQGDFARAEGFWRLALKQVEAQEQEKMAATLRSGPQGIHDLRTGDPVDDAGTVLLSKTGMPGATTEKTAATLKYRLPWATETSTGAHESAQAAEARSFENLGLSARANTPSVQLRSVPTSPRATKDDLARMLAAVKTTDTQAELKRSLQQENPAKTALAPSVTFNPATSRIEDLLPSKSEVTLASLLEPKRSTAPTPESGKIMDRIKALEGRNSPYLGLGGNVVSRNGQAGFERMMLQETTLESSTVMHGSIRASVIARSVFAGASGPDGQSLYRYGMLPQGDTFEAPGVSGFGAEAQISGNNFGLRFGSTPRGFAVQNFIGGFRFRPAGGPITLTFDRDSVKDTMLSYSGAQDPVSRRLWGGVIANSGTAAGNFGSEKSGAYFNLGFQHITGTSVQTNRRIDGTLGTYWRLVHTPAGSLNAGLNVFAMHYSKNLRYFTVGHGGYFSPQRFLLFNVPTTWSGKTKRLEYVVGTSIGSQSFREDASPYFPLDPLVQGTTGPYYGAMSSSGVNYNVDFRAAYQVAENWFLVGFLNVNNARFYSQQSAGISIRYSFRPRPLEADLTVPSIPDWRGYQPFGLR